MLKKKEKKDYVFKKLDELLKPQGYKAFKTGGPPTYVLKQKDKAISFSLYFKDMGQIDISELEISLFCVENYIIELFGKEYITEHYFYDEKKIFLSTVYDNETEPLEGLYRGIGYDVKTQEELETFTDWVINYLKTDGQKFIETYSYLPNILKRMDELLSEGKYWGDILSGGPENLFRGLIISKLCNDIHYEDKIKYVDKIFYEDPDEWIPYYEKLKERLKSVEPKYNI
ncbi:DUF4304 domain-containing protein [Candidatus Ornithobacterium hominis]|uniref:hypothetical protein n=1 Tax=Candidatus Ornithobacterium hominis TaxID=2497989 RepID=UPI0024BCC9D0|nr:hypothetical protein [Candidatus Ornithobacterium hominis]CAI9429333.1 DUF4304 domain-containing protein [Candidatus Ornithobacterium hominis]